MSDRLFRPSACQNRFLFLRAIETLVCLPLPFTPVTGFGRNEAVPSNARRDLPREQLVQLDLIGRDRDVAVAVVHLEL